MFSSQPHSLLYSRNLVPSALDLALLLFVTLLSLLLATLGSLRP